MPFCLSSLRKGFGNKIVRIDLVYFKKKVSENSIPIYGQYQNFDYNVEFQSHPPCFN